MIGYYNVLFFLSHTLFLQLLKVIKSYLLSVAFFYSIYRYYMYVPFAANTKFYRTLHRNYEYVMYMYVLSVTIKC